ncbi:MAG TPA: hypothetical protein VI072_30215, partial [Polyangiaceae bacterium]
TVASGAALAQSSTGAAFAETLYRQGRDLMAQGKAAEACPKFAESQRLDPATGTLLNLAACYETVGRLASAWLAYTEAAVAARRDGRADRVNFAEQRITLLEPKLSRLTVVVGPGADAPGLEVRLNGALFGSASRGVPTPVDPGTYRIEATAPGKKRWSEQLVIGKDAATHTATVPPLEDAPPDSAATPSTGADGSATLSGGDELARERPLTAPIYLAAGATLALAAGSAVTGVVYLQRKSDFDDANANMDRDVSKAEVEDLRDRAQSMALVSTALTAAAVVGAGITAGLYFSRPEQPASSALRTRRSSALPRLAPLVAPGAAGLWLFGDL